MNKKEIIEFKTEFSFGLLWQSLKNGFIKLSYEDFKGTKHYD